MSSSDAVAEIWLEVSDVRLETITDKDGTDIAVVDCVPGKITPYAVCMRMKETEPKFDRLIYYLTVDGHVSKSACGSSRLCKSETTFNGNYLGFAPIPQTPEGNITDSDLQKLGMIEVYISNAKQSTSRHIGGRQEVPTIEVPKYNLSEGKKALFMLQTASAGKCPTSVCSQYLPEYGNINTKLKIRYASRDWLRLRGLLPTCTKNDLASTSHEGQQKKKNIKDDVKPIKFERRLTRNMARDAKQTVIVLSDDSDTNENDDEVTESVRQRKKPKNEFST
mmetsp:Transcript_24864/g.34272  ORF Transcript_24864/g.34272 Transcript_24864/m.34272 type:complete len:279 (-) Transcript_24864:146-982(-)|eukprot:CAMPEP_0196586610 /NCGR_PEP_ID=MMETSP1081-20130531/54955_1 /TAXON_ID=36882 /ORGANISM="Pyramimonas amylifera, Strain CCMP720" /LENGTH=278 /DNA_ID=CAMNT_0041908549 /DNA_START=7 /DNA_END=843 /DNA_ORIENTATION=+